MVCATRRAVLVVLAVALMAFAVTSLAAPVQQASAASGDYSQVSATATQRLCSDARCGGIATVPAGTWVPTSCWRDGGTLNGTVRWFRVTYAGRVGWISASQTNPKAQASVPYCSNLLPNEALFAGEAVWSAAGGYELIMQGDGNLVAYGPSGALWASATNSLGAWSIMQGDGNLVVYSAAGSPLWATGTNFVGSTIAVQSDSNVVMYTGSTALWASNWHRYSGQPTRAWNAGVAGNCTWYAMDRIHQFWGRHIYPAISGDATNWDNSARQIGYLVQSTPATQAVVVFEGTLSNPAGHVAWVDAMQPRSDGTYIHIQEMNYKILYDHNERWIKAVPGLSYIPSPSI